MNREPVRGSYIGTLYVGRGAPQELWRVGSHVVVRDACARRAGRLDRLVAFIRACRLYRRVQRYGSEA
jgi:hypothetical protein